MNRRQLFLSTAKAALAGALGGVGFGSKSASAQAQTSAPAVAGGAPQVSGASGSPDATTTIDGRQLPSPPSQFGGVIKETAGQSTPWWPPRVVPPRGAPNVLLIMTDDQGYGVSSTFGGVIPTPALDRVANTGLRYTQFHSTALCSPTRAALVTGRNHHEVGFGVIAELSTGYPGYDAYIGPEHATVGRILRGNGYATSWFGKNHNTPGAQYAGPYDQWPSGMDFDYFYGFMGGETDQWTPYLFRDHTQIFPWVGKPGYDLTTDLADEAISHVRKLSATAPDQPFFVYYVPGGSHSPHQPTQEWIDKFKGKFDMGWNAMREQIFANQKRLGVVPANTELTEWPDSLAKWETLSADEKKLFAKQAEVFAAYTAYTDHEIGRVIQEVEDQGKLDNTLIIYICGDNGTSPEGTLVGTPNQYTAYNGFLDVPIEEQLRYYDNWGLAPTYPHMAVAWSWAFDTPFKWTKQVASHFGGTRQGLAISWPARIKDAGGIRTQFHHIIDIVPTILEATGISAPQFVKRTRRRLRQRKTGMSDSSQAPGTTRQTRPRCKPDYCLNLGVTWAGLLALEVKGRVPDLSFKSFGAFTAGAAARAELIGDTGPNAPQHWVGGFGTDDAHILATLHAISPEALTTYSARLSSLFAESGACEELWRGDGAALTKSKRASACPQPASTSATPTASA